MRPDTLRCKCGEPAERNEYGELLCELCALFSSRGTVQRIQEERRSNSLFTRRPLIGDEEEDETDCTDLPELYLVEPWWR